MPKGETPKVYEAHEPSGIIEKTSFAEEGQEKTEEFERPEKSAAEIAADLGFKAGEEVRFERLPRPKEQSGEAGQEVMLSERGWEIEGFLKEKDGSVKVFLKRVKTGETLKTNLEQITKDESLEIKRR